MLNAWMKTTHTHVISSSLKWNSDIILCLLRLISWHRLTTEERNLSEITKAKCITRKTSGAAERPAFLQFHSCDIKINVLSTTSIYRAYRPPTTQNLNDLDFDLSRSLIDKCYGALGFLIYDFLLMLPTLWYGLTRLLYEIPAFKIWVTLTSTFQGHSRSNMMVPLDSPPYNSD